MENNRQKRIYLSSSATLRAGLTLIFTLLFCFDSWAEELEILCAGDIMLHHPLLKSNYDDQKSDFDFSSCFNSLAPYYKEDFLIIANLETVLAGKNGFLNKNPDTYFKGYQGYPLFCSPDQLARDLANFNIDILLTANNHSLDSGEKGHLRSLEVIEKAGMDYCGSGMEKARKLQLHQNGLRLIIINYTFGTNKLRLPKNSKLKINSLDAYQSAKIKIMLEEIEEAAQTPGLDLLVMTLHFGKEFQSRPGRFEKQLVNQIFKAGADIIFCAHPHVVQPLEIKYFQNGQKENRIGLVFYSLGNLLAAHYRHGQRRIENMPVDWGLSVISRIKKEENGSRLSALKLLPSFVKWQQGKILLIPSLEDNLQQMQKKWQLDDYSFRRLRKQRNELPSLLLEYNPKLKYKLVPPYWEVQINDNFYFRKKDIDPMESP